MLTGPAEAALVAEACAALGVSDEEELPGGADKLVRLVRLDGTVLVLKVVALRPSAPDALWRAEREVELLASLRTPHVGRVASALVRLGDPARAVAWLEEHLDGEDVTLLLGRRQWSWFEAATLGLHVARGLGAAHEKDVVHRDVSSSNVRRVSDGSYKVMDFGVARHTSSAGLTVARQPGTRGFASPEHVLARAGVLTPASDVFAVGILMYVALTATSPIPFAGDDADYARRLRAAEIAEDLRTARPDLRGDEAALVMRCLERRPAGRYADGTELAAALEALM